MVAPQQDEHAYLKQLLEHAPDGVFTIDTDLRIRYVNPAFCKLLGYPPEALRGSSITDHLGDLDILGTCMASVATQGHCTDQETLFKRADGSVVHISKNVQAIYDDDQRIREILVTLRDLSQLHRLNQQLEESLQAREAANQALQATLDTLRETQQQLVQSEKMAALGSLVAGMAHEINTPIGVGVTSASSIHEETARLRHSLSQGGMKRSELEQYLRHTEQASEIMLSNLRRAAELISSFKQVAVDQASDEWRRINLHGYVDEVLLSLRPKLKQSRIDILNACDPGLELLTHPGAIYQILSNLTLNALTHAYEADQPGRVCITAGRTPEGIHLSFSDDGKGIAPQHLGRIFEPFYTTRRGQGGSGLGLHIVYNLATGPLKGRIRVDSQPGQGTAFHLDIPTSSQGQPA